MTPPLPPDWRAPIDLWWYIALILNANAQDIVLAVLPSEATREEGLEQAEILRRRPIAWAWGLDEQGTARLRDVVERYAATQRRK